MVPVNNVRRIPGSAFTGNGIGDGAQADHFLLPAGPLPMNLIGSPLCLGLLPCSRLLIDARQYC
jgi:hypothetical protein